MRALENDRISSTEKGATKECRQYQEEYGREDKGNETVVLPCGQGLHKTTPGIMKKCNSNTPMKHNNAIKMPLVKQKDNGNHIICLPCVDLNYVALDQPSLQLLRNDVDNV